MDLACPQCGAPVTAGDRVRLDARVRETGEAGVVVLSAIFGDYSVTSDLRVEEGMIVDFACPVCEASLMLPVSCKLCRAPMAALNLVRGGYLEFCSRRGCRAHGIGGVGDIDQLMGLVNRMLDTPYD
jgi:predicted RNA-binding Zn-ribbon protein involved in translation (DUF1610 family)